jgi:hypothetical protein
MPGQVSGRASLFPVRVPNSLYQAQDNINIICLPKFSIRTHGRTEPALKKRTLSAPSNDGRSMFKFDHGCEKITMWLVFPWWILPLPARVPGGREVFDLSYFCFCFLFL